MSVADLHPEDLLDREVLGVLTASERALLDAHLAQCSACRFERHARVDFNAELGAEPSHDGSLVRIAIERAAQVPMVAAPLPENTVAGAAEPARLPAVAPGRRTGRTPRRVASLVLVAATFLLATASFAAAGGSFTSILRQAGLLSQPEVEAPPPAKTAASPSPVARKVPVVRERSAEGAELVTEKDPQRESVPEPSFPPVDESPVAAAVALVPSAAPRVVAPPSANGPRRAVSNETHAALSEPVKVTSSVATPAPAVDAAAMFQEASVARRRGEHARAATLYRELGERFPSAPEAATAQVTFARMLLDDGDPAAAVPLFDRYLARGKTTLREEALVGRARALSQLGRTDGERAAWELLKAEFPGSLHVHRADARLLELGSR